MVAYNVGTRHHSPLLPQMLDQDGSGDITFAEFVLILVVGKISHRTLGGGQGQVLSNSSNEMEEMEAAAPTSSIPCSSP